LGNIGIWQIIIVFITLIIGVLPWVLALISKKAKGNHKIIWFLMSFFISWVGYLAYYFVVIKELPENNT
jgi:hypothetical protein|tara:strand:+ start:622 stop:828 length:207 start_codon:yes stop_codon:yes gene_type:complete